jgi:hypothetical protein
MTMGSVRSVESVKSVIFHYLPRACAPHALPYPNGWNRTQEDNAGSLTSLTSPTGTERAMSPPSPGPHIARHTLSPCPLVTYEPQHARSVAHRGRNYMAGNGLAARSISTAPAPSGRTAGADCTGPNRGTWRTVSRQLLRHFAKTARHSALEHLPQRQEAAA